MAKQSDSAPEFVKYVGPVIEALTALGDSGRPDEVRSVHRAVSPCRPGRLVALGIVYGR